MLFPGHCYDREKDAQGRADTNFPNSRDPVQNIVFSKLGIVLG